MRGVRSTAGHLLLEYLRFNELLCCHVRHAQSAGRGGSTPAAPRQTEREAAAVSVPEGVRGRTRAVTSRGDKLHGQGPSRRDLTGGSTGMYFPRQALPF